MRTENNIKPIPRSHCGVYRYIKSALYLVAPRIIFQIMFAVGNVALLTMSSRARKMPSDAGVNLRNTARTPPKSRIYSFIQRAPCQHRSIASAPTKQMRVCAPVKFRQTLEVHSRAKQTAFEKSTFWQLNNVSSRNTDVMRNKAVPVGDAVAGVSTKTSLEFVPVTSRAVPLEQVKQHRTD